MITRIFLSLIFLAYLQGLNASEEMRETFELLKASLKPLSLSSHEATDHADAYLKFYSLDFDDVKHSIGTLRSGPNTLVAQVFQIEHAKGTVILSHGYYDHAGVLKHLIRYLIESGFNVAVIDHAGHGLSSGAPAAIGDFDEYVDGLKQLINFCDQQIPGTLHLVAHSMGCAICLDSLLKGRELAVERVILLAPLVRSKGWKASGLGLKLLGKKIESVPRKFRKNSSDDSFLAFHKADPLQAKAVPMSWVAAHRKWCEQIQKIDNTVQKEITIIQGNKDSTVDWEYNTKFLKEHIPAAKVNMIDGAGHQLINEAPEIRNAVLKKILEVLQ